jgi:uncharacterized protein (DUF427 family)
VRSVTADPADYTITLPPTRVDPSPRRVRVRAGDTLVADSTRALLLVWYGPGLLPTYCLPPGDVDAGLMVPAVDAGPGLGGVTVVHDVRAGDTTVAGVAHLFRDPPEPIGALDGYWTFAWDAGLSWFEEALEVHVHARDPRQRVDVVPSDRHVRVELDGVVLADSTRPHALFETSLPTRWYLPLEDVRQDLLEPSDMSTSCPYKGTARYWSARIGDELRPDVAWSYPEPIPECPRIAGLVCFFNERVDLTIDGEREARPVTPWSA